MTTGKGQQSGQMSPLADGCRLRLVWRACVADVAYLTAEVFMALTCIVLVSHTWRWSATLVTTCISSSVANPGLAPGPYSCWKQLLNTVGNHGALDLQKCAWLCVSVLCLSFIGCFARTYSTSRAASLLCLALPHFTSIICLASVLHQDPKRALIVVMFGSAVACWRSVNVRLPMYLFISLGALDLSLNAAYHIRHVSSASGLLALLPSLVFCAFLRCILPYMLSCHTPQRVAGSLVRHTSSAASPAHNHATASSAETRSSVQKHRPRSTCVRDTSDPAASPAGEDALIPRNPDLDRHDSARHNSGVAKEVACAHRSATPVVAAPNNAWPSTTEPAHPEHLAGLWEAQHQIDPAASTEAGLQQPEACSASQAQAAAAPRPLQAPCKQRATAADVTNGGAVVRSKTCNLDKLLLQCMQARGARPSPLTYKSRARTCVISLKMHTHDDEGFQEAALRLKMRAHCAALRAAASRGLDPAQVSATTCCFQGCVHMISVVSYHNEQASEDAPADADDMSETALAAAAADDASSSGDTASNPWLLAHHEFAELPDEDELAALLDGDWQEWPLAADDLSAAPLLGGMGIGAAGEPLPPTSEFPGSSQLWADGAWCLQPVAVDTARDFDDSACAVALRWRASGSAAVLDVARPEPRPVEVRARLDSGVAFADSQIVGQRGGGHLLDIYGSGIHSSSSSAVASVSGLEDDGAALQGGCEVKVLCTSALLRGGSTVRVVVSDAHGALLVDEPSVLEPHRGHLALRFLLEPPCAPGLLYVHVVADPAHGEDVGTALPRNARVLASLPLLCLPPTAADEAANVFHALCVHGAARTGHTGHLPSSSILSHLGGVAPPAAARGPERSLYGWPRVGAATKPEPAHVQARVRAAAYCGKFAPFATDLGGLLDSREASVAVAYDLLQYCVQQEMWACVEVVLSCLHRLGVALQVGDSACSVADALQQLRKSWVDIGSPLELDEDECACTYKSAAAAAAWPAWPASEPVLLEQLVVRLPRAGGQGDDIAADGAQHVEAEGTGCAACTSRLSTKVATTGGAWAAAQRWVSLLASAGLAGVVVLWVLCALRPWSGAALAAQVVLLTLANLCATMAGLTCLVGGRWRVSAALAAAWVMRMCALATPLQWRPLVPWVEAVCSTLSLCSLPLLLAHALGVLRLPLRCATPPPGKQLPHSDPRCAAGTTPQLSKCTAAKVQSE